MDLFALLNSGVVETSLAFSSLCMTLCRMLSIIERQGRKEMLQLFQPNQGCLDELCTASSALSEEVHL